MRPSGLIGVVHLIAMPGDPAHQGGGFGAVEAAALADLAALSSGGITQVVIENFGSAPFVKGTAGDRLAPHHVACLALVARAARESYGMTVGVNCLRNDAISALGIAAAAGAEFVRVNVHTGVSVTDQGVIEGEAAASMRYRQLIGAGHVAVLADVLVKHAAPLAPMSARELTHDCVDRGLADGVIVTGRATGAPVDLALLEEVAGAAGDAWLYIGSGLTLERAQQLAPRVHGAIVGTALKREGRTRAPVDEARVRALVEATAGLWRQIEPIT